ncbi:hypothetical protein DVK01_18525 [Haloarcula sp. Atlit-120R]|nr:hypothetical protein DVK01_18525 [Haloarcula sp. Atlit-120R]
MVPLTRRQLLQHTAAGGGVLALVGCTTPNVLGLFDGESVPKLFTNDAHTASYTAAGCWLLSTSGHYQDGCLLLEIVRKGRSDTIDRRVVIPFLDPRRKPLVRCFDRHVITNDAANQ